MGNSWYCCQPDLDEAFELCRIQKVSDPAGNIYWAVITYYEGKELYSGSMKACKDWINSHWVERRYLDYYGKN